MIPVFYHPRGGQPVDVRQATERYMEQYSEQTQAVMETLFIEAISYFRATEPEQVVDMVQTHVRTISRLGPGQVAFKQVHKTLGPTERAKSGALHAAVFYLTMAHIARVGKETGQYPVGIVTVREASPS